MKYSDIITLRSMRSAYNIQEEKPDEWKTFIANKVFNQALWAMIKAVANNDADNHKPVWISGTYGSGKSHAGAVLKHLFCDPVDQIREYVDDEYHEERFARLRNGLYNVRERKRLFPVELYGQQNIAHVEDLSLQLQREVTEALHKAGITLAVKTDFDTLVEHIDQQPVIWQSLLDKNSLLSSVAPDLEKLKQLLRNCDTEVLERVRNALRQTGIDIRLKGNKIKEWIVEVQNQLRELTDYDGLLIIWDEFTEIMTSTLGEELLEKIQEVNEAMTSSENDSYFLLIAHPSALLSLNEDERKKTLGRYHYISYNMDPVSAFKIMSKKFKVLDRDCYDKLKNNFFSHNDKLVPLFATTSANAQETINDIKNLFPIHPATANLAAYYAREAGSSSRSVFDFLASDMVRDFLDNEENYALQRTITCDLLWDYVRPTFESDTARFGAVTERYNSHHLAVEAQGENCLRVFKGILLLNALNNIAHDATVTPSKGNIENLFVGTQVWDELPAILAFLNDKSIIQRQPDGNYSILFTALPGDEIVAIKQKLAASTFLTADQVIKFGERAKKYFDLTLVQVVRPKYFQFFSRQNNEYTLLNQIENTQNNAKGYEVYLAILVGKNKDDIFVLKDIAERQSKDPDRFQNTTFVVMEEPFGDKNYERFIEYQANAECAQRHGLANQQRTYSMNASEMIVDWCKRMKGHNVTLYLRGKRITIEGSHMASTVNNHIAPLIFTSGPESLAEIRMKCSTTYWKKASVKSTVDAVLSFGTKQEIINACKGPGRHVEMLLQDSVNDDLTWKTDVSPNHPLKRVCDYIDEWLSGKHTNKNQSFNLGDKLKGLTQPPFGLFQSYAPMAMVAFAMRKYVNLIYDTHGKPRTAKHLIGDVVEMFNAWESGRSSSKLEFMFESKEAGRLTKVLIKMFVLNKLKGGAGISSLKEARWAITHDFASLIGYPLWALKYCDSEFNRDDTKSFIDHVQRIVTDPESVKNPQLLAETINEYDKLKYDVGNMMVENGGANFKQGFDNFMKSVDKVNVTDAEVDSAFAYLKQHLEGECGLWREDEVTDRLKDWRIDQQPKKPAAPVTYSQPVTKPPVAGEGVEAETRAKRAKLHDWLNITPPTEAKEVLQELVEKGDYSVLQAIEKYV